MVDSQVGDLIASFVPAVSEAPVPVADPAAAQSRAILLAPPAAEFYLEPLLSTIPHEASANAFCCLIDAPAGVGKTALAHYLMRRLAHGGRLVVYVPLKGAIIGQGFFSGLLSDLFPNSSKTDLLKAIFNGRVVVVFDGYDEVSMTSEQLELNQMFIGEIVAAAQTVQAAASVRRSIVFLFRSVFFEFGIFDEIVPFADHYRVKYFDRTRRRSYLIGQLEARSAGTIKGLSSGNIPSVIDNFLKGFEVRLTVASADREDAFFGHALVLSALADYIIAALEDAASGNVHKLAQEFSGDRLDTIESVDLLKGVEEQILSREAGKFPDEDFELVPGFVGYPLEMQRGLLDALARDVVIGGGQEASQVVVVLGRLAEDRLESYPAYRALSPDKRRALLEKYREELRNKFDNHPFVDFTAAGKYRFRNPVYEELYLARFIAETPSTQLRPVYSGSRTFSYFLALFLLDALGGDLSSHSSMLFEIINLLSTSCNGAEYRVVLRRDVKASRWTGEVTSSNVVIRPFFVAEDILLIEVPPGALLQHFDISGEGCVVGIIGSPPGHSAVVTLLDTEVAVEHLEIDAHRVVFESVAINSRSLQFGDRVVTVDGLDTLTLWNPADLQIVASERVAGRLLRLIEETEGSAENSLDVFKVKLKKILSWFRRHGKDTYGVVEVRFWTVATNKRADVTAVRIVECLKAEGILSFNEGVVLLEQSALERYGIYYLKQNEIAFKDKVSDLFAAYQASK